MPGSSTVKVEVFKLEKAAEIEILLQNYLNELI
jgi:hypothetical protein